MKEFSKLTVDEVSCKSSAPRFSETQCILSHTALLFLLFLHIPCWSVITAVCTRSRRNAYCEQTDSIHESAWWLPGSQSIGIRPAIIRLIFSKKLLRGMPLVQTSILAVGVYVLTHQRVNVLVCNIRFATAIQLRKHLLNQLADSFRQPP